MKYFIFAFIFCSFLTDANASPLFGFWDKVVADDLKECRADPKGKTCIQLANKRDIGYRIPKNSNYHAVKLLEISCGAKNYDACIELDILKRAGEEAKKCYFEEGVDLCKKFALDNLRRAKKFPQERDRYTRYARRHYSLACFRKDQESCKNLKLLNKMVTDFNEVYSLYQDSSVTISTHKGNVMGLKIHGEIKKGDYEEFIEWYLRYDGKLKDVFLDSPGGDALEAIKIGRLIRELKLTTWVPSGSPERPICFSQDVRERGLPCTCMSSCFLIHAAGTQKFGSLVGIHRIYPRHEILRMLTADQASTLHKSISKGVKGYLADMGVSREFTNKLLSIPSDKIEYLTKEEIKRQLPLMLPELQEWFYAKCGNTESIMKEMRDWYKRHPEIPESMTTGEVKRRYPEYKKLDDKYSNVSKCENSLLADIQREAHNKRFPKRKR